MTIRELYKILENCGIKHGWDLPVVVSNDCEGNGYSTFNKDVAVSMVRDGEDEWLEKVNRQEVDWSSINEHGYSGVCLYPWEDNYPTAERACKGDKNDKI